MAAEPDYTQDLINAVDAYIDSYGEHSSVCVNHQQCEDGESPFMRCRQYQLARAARAYRGPVAAKQRRDMRRAAVRGGYDGG